ncbi:MAG TPA: Gfo/Idh/MocA family oxidoreductase [Bryobacteraceae bacterium]|nr:Gfo/Idh/MocA family oxidoreductase [Bryobacteraceae bacterium]
MSVMEISRRNFIQGAAALPAFAARPLAANDRIRFGIIGAGARSHQIMEAMKLVPGIEFAAVVDAYKGRVERAVARTEGKAKPYRDYREILADKSIDAVVIATPDHWHKQMVVEAVRAGKDVYCEKPLTYRTSDGPEIIRAAKETGRMVQVGSQGMSSPLETRARDIIRSGRLGKITLIRASFNRNTPSGAWIYPIPPDCSPETVNWDMFLGSAPKRPFSPERFFRWRCYFDYSGGISTDLFVHLCTTIHYVMDAKVASRAVALSQLYRWKETRDVPDTINGVLEYPEGFAVSLSGTFNNETGSESGFQILGTEGTLNLGGTLAFRPEHVHDDNGWIVDSWAEPLAKAYYKNPKVIAEERPDMGAPKVEATGEFYREIGPESTVAHMGHFVESIRTRKPYWEDASAGHHAAACAHMVNMAARTGRVVEWDFNQDDVKAS